MCLIAYSPDAKAIPANIFVNADVDNPDGIGFMSALGVARFLGIDQYSRAVTYMDRLVAQHVPYAIHWRFATHGMVSKRNTHPFKVPGAPLYLMHNGVLWTSSLSTERDSDTAIFAREIMPQYAPYIASGDPEQAWLPTLISEVWGSKLVLFNEQARRFHIVNEQGGEWRGGIWYSNDHSFPKAMKKARSKFGPLSIGAHDTFGAYIKKANGLSYYRNTRADEEREYQAWLEERQCLSPYAKAKADGFDWHDSTTWDRYPALAAPPRDEEMDGVQEYV